MQGDYPRAVFAASVPGTRHRTSPLLTGSATTARRTRSGVGALLAARPRSYQVTPDIPDRRRATQRKAVRPNGRQCEIESARGRLAPLRRDRASPTRIQTASVEAQAG